jgi:hypothetical protein
MAIENFYVSCTLKRPTETTVYGRPSKTYAQSTINGYKGSQSDSLKVVADKDTYVSTYKFFSDTALQYGDILVYEGEQYEVASDCKNTVHLNHHYRTTIRKIENVKQ